MKEASVAANYRRPAPAFHVMAALPAPPAPVPDEAVEEPAGAVEAAPPPVVEPEVCFAFLLFRSAEPCEAARFFATCLRIFLLGIFYTSERSSPFCFLVATCLLGCYFSICWRFCRFVS